MAGQHGRGNHHLNLTADLTSAQNPTRALANFLNSGQAVVASHAFSSSNDKMRAVTGAAGADKDVNKTISDSN